MSEVMGAVALFVDVVAVLLLGIALGFWLGCVTTVKYMFFMLEKEPEKFARWTGRNRAKAGPP